MESPLNYLQKPKPKNNLHYSQFGAFFKFISHSIANKIHVGLNFVCVMIIPDKLKGRPTKSTMNLFGMTINQNLAKPCN